MYGKIVSGSKKIKNKPSHNDILQQADRWKTCRNYERSWCQSV